MFFRFKQSNTLFIFIIFSVLFGFLYADDMPISLRTEIDTTMATIGDRLNLRAFLSYPEGTIFESPQLKKESGDVEFLDIKESKEKKIPGGYERSWVITFAVFDTGRVTVPSIEIRARTVSDSTNFLSFITDPQIVEVVSVLPPGTVEPKDIKPPFPLRKSIPWDIIILLLVLVAAIVGCILYYRHWRKLHPVIPFDEKFLESPHKIAFDRLNGLREKGCSSPEEQKEYYSEISEIIRDYMERRFFIRALEMTTQEINDSFDYIDIDTKILRNFRSLLEKSDMVKFAKFLPPLNDLPSDWESAYRCVDNTKYESFLHRRSM